MVFDGKQPEFPTLTRNEQVRLHELGTPEAREKLILSISAWAVELARRMSKGGDRIPLDDLVGYSLLGSVEAVDSWKPEKGALSTHTTVRCRGKMLEALGREGVIKIPLNLFWLLLRKEDEAILYVAEARRTFNIGTIDNFSGEVIYERGPGVHELKEAEFGELRERLKKSLGILTEQERRILNWLSQGLSMKKIAKKVIGVSGRPVTRSRIQQLKSRAIKKLQADLGIEITASKKNLSKQKKRVSKKEPKDGT